jgi:hypothetical protein
MPGELVAVAAIVVGFGLTVIMFRIQRELWVQEKHPDWPNWLAWSDYLIILSLLLGVIVSVILLLPDPTPRVKAFASAACVAAFILQVGYIPAILAHYRIEMGRKRAEEGKPRERGEPIERRVVRVSVFLATVVFIFMLWEHLRR